VRSKDHLDNKDTVIITIITQHVLSIQIRILIYFLNGLQINLYYFSFQFQQTGASATPRGGKSKHIEDEMTEQETLIKQLLIDNIPQKKYMKENDFSKGVVPLYGGTPKHIYPFMTCVNNQRNHERARYKATHSKDSPCKSNNIMVGYTTVDLDEINATVKMHWVTTVDTDGKMI
jgi:hypothetical protein